MKNRIAGKLGYLGAGIGLTLFAVFGLMPGAFIGGIVGLNIVSNVIDGPAMPTLLPRIFTAVGMLGGVMVAGLMFITSGATIGWLIGTVADAVSKTPAMARAHK